MRIEAVFESAGCHRAYLSLSHATGTGRLKGGFCLVREVRVWNPHGSGCIRVAKSTT